MRELICTVSGNSAETTKPNTIRITNDRNNHPYSGAKGDFLSDSGFGRIGSVRPSFGLREPIGHEEGQRGGVPAEAGEDGQAASGDGRDSRLTFPFRVKLAVAVGSALFVVAMWLLGRIAVYLVGAISSLSGFWWLVGGGAAFLLFSLLFSLVRIAAVSDRRAAEMVGKR